MRTKLIYLEDSYQKEMDASILEVVSDGEGKYRLILDETVFYAMGGGQPTDQGKLTSKLWSGDVYQVLIKEGELWHFVNSPIVPVVGDTIHGIINWERRYKNMQKHTGGHIIDFALFLLGYTPEKLFPIKADHGKKPFILYQGILTRDIKQALQEKVDELIMKNLKFSCEFVTHAELQKKAIYLQQGLPINKPLRALALETVGVVADGGTQLNSTSEAGKVCIDKITSENEVTTINYSLSY